MRQDRIVELRLPRQGGGQPLHTICMPLLCFASATELQLTKSLPPEYIAERRRSAGQKGRDRYNFRHKTLSLKRGRESQPQSDRRCRPLKKRGRFALCKDNLLPTKGNRITTVTITNIDQMRGGAAGPLWR